MQNDSIFWDKSALKYSKSPVPDALLYKQKLEKTQKLLTNDMTILEVGCGTGTTILKHAPFVHKAIANDFSQAMIEIAQEKAKIQKIENVEFKVESIEAMNYPEESFDLIMAHSVIHLVRDREETIKKLTSLLKKDGLLILNTPCIDDFFKLFKYIWKPFYKLGFFPYVQSFTKYEMVSLIDKNDFQVIEEWHPDKRNIFQILKRK